MKKSHVSDDGSPQHSREHDKGSKVMLSKPTSSRQLPHPTYLSADNGTVISSINGTLVIQVKADAYNYNNIDLTTINDSSSSNTTTLSYEQLSRQFYQSYDPSIGLHTAAVLGGILVWLVLYVIYRTKVRKCIIRLIKKTFRNEDEFDAKVSGSEKESSNNSTMVRNLMNPSIVIEASPSQSLAQSPLTCDQDCLSPYSIPGAGNEDGVVFRFPNPRQGHNTHQELCHCHLHCCTDQHEVLLQLPKSELDVSSATAQWVQNMPLAARSQQDFARLMLSLQSHGLLAMHKPCSCPLVCPRTPQPLPLLELPNTWNKSLPVLSNSLSSQILSAYEAVINNQTKDKGINDFINAKRILNNNKVDCYEREKGYDENTFLLDKNLPWSAYSNRRQSHAGFSQNNNNIRKKLGKTPPYLTINIPGGKENTDLTDSTTLTRSHMPIPVTPTVMIQNSKTVHKQHRSCDSNRSVSSSSSTDILLAPPHAPLIHISKPGSSRIPSPHLLSPKWDNRSRSGSQNFSWSYGDIKRFHDNKDTFRSGSVSPHSCNTNHHHCSFKYHKRDNTMDTNSRHSGNSCSFSRHRSLYDKNRTHVVNTGLTPYNPGGLSYHCRSLSDSNCRNLDNSNYNSNLQLNSCFQTQHQQRSRSADVSFSLNLQREKGSPVCSNESNKNSLGTSSRSLTPAPYLLQVPDPCNYFRPVTPDCGVNKNLTDISNTGYQSAMRHCVHSDGNIAYRAGQYCPAVPNVDQTVIRRHSTFSCGPGEINLSSFWGDNTVRPSSSLGSSGMSSLSPHHSHLPHHHNNHHSHHPPQQHHHSTGMLGVDNYKNQRCGLYSHNSLNRSYSAVMMETKL